jgi:hypothetical protein
MILELFIYFIQEDEIPGAYGSFKQEKQLSHEELNYKIRLVNKMAVEF